MPESVQITLRYQGKDVDDGTMVVSDVIVALQGLSGAYGKIASATDPRGHHEIRVADINKSSFAVLLFAWALEHRESILQASLTAAPAVVGLIIRLIEFKKNLKGKEPTTIQINGDGNIVVMGEGNTQMIMPKEIYDLYRSNSIDTDLAKIVKPLEEDSVDRVELSTRDSAGNIEKAEILSSDKQYFQNGDTTTTTSKPTQLAGELISLNKETNRGMFRMQTGKTVKYHLAGSDLSEMYIQFARKGMVRVECIASFD